jgi:tRNA threonylcarbamoyladenosine biosynthesis protein TsaE
MERFLASPDDTHALGVALGRAAFPGTALALIGDLGAGKTALVRGLAEGLGAAGRVQSPTFTLVQPHADGRLPLWHADWYRLRDAGEAAALGLFELGEEGVVAIEWADRFPELLPDDHLRIALRDEGTGRQAELAATGPRHRALLEALGA